MNYPQDQALVQEYESILLDIAEFIGEATDKANRLEKEEIRTLYLLSKDPDEFLRKIIQVTLQDEADQKELLSMF